MQTNNITAKAFIRSPESKRRKSTKNEERPKDTGVTGPGPSSEECRPAVTTTATWKQCTFSNTRRQPSNQSRCEQDGEFQDCAEFPAVEGEDLIDLYLQFGADHSRTSLLTESFTSVNDRDFQLCEAKSCTSSESFYSVISNDYYPWLMVKQVGVATSFPGNGCFRLVANDDSDLSAVTAADLLELSILMDLEAVNDKEPEEKAVEIVKRRYEENTNFNPKRKGVSIYDVNKSSKCGPAGHKSSVSYYTENSLAHNITSLSTSDYTYKDINTKIKIEESVSTNGIDLTSPKQAITCTATQKDVLESRLQEEKNISEAITNFTRSLKKFNRGTGQRKPNQSIDQQRRVSTEQHQRTEPNRYPSNVTKKEELKVVSHDGKQLSPRKSQSECNWKVFCHKWTLEHMNEANVSERILVRESKEEISENCGNQQMSSVLNSNDEVSKVALSPREESANAMSQSNDRTTPTSKRRTTCPNLPVVQESSRENVERASNYSSVTIKPKEEQPERKRSNTLGSVCNNQKTKFDLKVTLCEDNPNIILEKGEGTSTKNTVTDSSVSKGSFLSPPPSVPNKTWKETPSKQKKLPNSEKQFPCNKSVVSNVEYQTANLPKNQTKDNDKTDAKTGDVSRLEKSSEGSAAVKSPGVVQSHVVTESVKSQKNVDTDAVTESVQSKKNVNTDQVCSKGKYGQRESMSRNVNGSTTAENTETTVKSNIAENVPQEGVYTSSNGRHFLSEINNDTMLKQTTPGKENDVYRETTVSTVTRQSSDGKDKSSNVFREEETVNKRVTFDGAVCESSTQKSSYRSEADYVKGVSISFDQVRNNSSQPPMTKKSGNQVRIDGDETAENRMYQQISAKQNTSTTPKGDHIVTMSEKENNVTTTNLVSANDGDFFKSSEQEHALLDIVQSCSEAMLDELVGGSCVHIIEESIDKILRTDYKDVIIEILDEVDKHVVKLEFLKEGGDNLSSNEMPSTSGIELVEEVFHSGYDEDGKHFVISEVQESYKSINNKNIGFGNSKNLDKTRNQTPASNVSTAPTFGTYQKALGSTPVVPENSIDKGNVDSPLEYKKAMNTEKRSSIKDVIETLETRCKTETESETVASNKQVSYSTGKDEACNMFKDVSTQIEPISAKINQNDTVTEKSSDTVRKSAFLSTKDSGNADATFLDDQKISVTKNNAQTSSYLRQSETDESSRALVNELNVPQRKNMGINCDLGYEINSRRVESSNESAKDNKTTQSNISRNMVSASTRISPTDFTTNFTMSNVEKYLSSSQENEPAKGNKTTQSNISQNMVSASTRISPTDFTSNFTMSNVKKYLSSSQENETAKEKKSTLSNIAQNMVSASTRISPTEFATDFTMSTEKKYESEKNTKTNQSQISQNMVSASTRFSPTDFSTNFKMSNVKKYLLSSQENEPEKDNNTTQSHISQNMASSSTRISPTDFSTNFKMSNVKKYLLSSQENEPENDNNTTQSQIPQNMASSSTRISPTDFSTNFKTSNVKKYLSSSQENEPVKDNNTTQSQISQNMISASTRISPTDFTTNFKMSNVKKYLLSSQENEPAKDNKTTHSHISKNMVSGSTRISPTEFATDFTMSSNSTRISPAVPNTKLSIFTSNKQMSSAQDKEGNAPNVNGESESQNSKRMQTKRMSVKDAVASIESRCRLESVPGRLFATKSAPRSADKDESYTMFRNATIPVEPRPFRPVTNDSVTPKPFVRGNQASLESTKLSNLFRSGNPQGNFQNQNYQTNTQRGFAFNSYAASKTENGIFTPECNLGNKEEHYVARTNRVTYNKKDREDSTNRIPSENPSRCSSVSIESEENEMMTIKNTSYRIPGMRRDNQSISRDKDESYIMFQNESIEEEPNFTVRRSIDVPKRRDNPSISYSRDKDESYVMLQNESVEEEPNFTVRRSIDAPKRQNRLMTTEKDSNSVEFASPNNSIRDSRTPDSAFVSIKDLGSDASTSSENEYGRRSPSPATRTSENQSYRHSTKKHGVKYEVRTSEQKRPVSLSTRQTMSRNQKSISREENVDSRREIDTNNVEAEQNYGSIKSEKRTHKQTSKGAGKNKVPPESCIRELRSSTSAKFTPSSQYEGGSFDAVQTFHTNKDTLKQGLKIETTATRGRISSTKQTVAANEYKQNKQVSHSPDKEETRLSLRNATLEEEAEVYPKEKMPGNDFHSVNPKVYLEEKSGNLVVTFLGGISESIIPKSAFLSAKDNSKTRSISSERAATGSSQTTPTKHCSGKKKTQFDHIVSREKKFVCKKCKTGEKVRLIEKTDRGSSGLDFDFSLPQKKQNVIAGKNLLSSVTNLLNTAYKPSRSETTECTKISHSDGHDITHSRTKIRCSLCKISQ